MTPTIEKRIIGVFNKKPISPPSWSVPINEVIKAYLDRKLVLVLGAGVSTKYGLPSWEVLLQKLLINAFLQEKNKSEENVALADLFTKVFPQNQLVSARYLQKHVQGKKRCSFENVVRKALYENINSTNDVELFRQIKQLCASPGKNPPDSIITYNYDDVLEDFLSKSDVKISYAPIYYAGTKHNVKVHIYHVHGFLPRGCKLTEKHKIIFSEDSYHQQYTDAYNWSNIVQINKFTDNICLFIGVSFTDPNLRRLLDIAKLLRGKSKKYHYRIKKRLDLEEIKEKLKKIFKNKEGLDAIAKKLIHIKEKFEEDDALSLCVRTIWVKDYDKDTPEILKKINES